MRHVHACSGIPRPAGRLAQHLCAAVLWSLLAAADAIAQFGGDGFAPRPNGVVRAVLPLDDGRMLVAGEFDTLDGQPCLYLCRVEADGRRDASFVPVTPNAPVTAMLRLPDGRIVISGEFDAVGGQPRARLARLNADGSLDASFHLGLNSPALARALERDGSVLVGGAFAFGNFQRLVRIRADGSLDQFFRPRFDAQADVRAIVVRGDDSILIGGAITTVNEQPRDLALLNRDGVLDPRFAVSLEGVVNALALQPDGSVIVAGAFIAVGQQPRNALVRLDDHGNVDFSFAPIVNDEVRAALVVPDGQILIAGVFDSVNGEERFRVARLRFNGATDPTPVFEVQGTIDVLARQADGRALIGGDFGITGTPILTNLARLESDASVERALLGNTARATAIAQQADGRLLVAHTPSSSAGDQILTRLLPDGRVDSGFDPPQFNGPVLDLAVQRDGRILARGLFDRIDTMPAANLVRFNADGTRDTGFAIPDTLQVSDFELLADGRMLLLARDTDSGSDELLSILVRRFPDGSADPDFILNIFEGFATHLALQADGNILVAFQPEPDSDDYSIQRVRADSSRDSAYQVQIDGPVAALHALPDGRLLVGGRFASLQGNARALLARLRLDGSFDPTFNAAMVLPPPGLQDPAVTSIAVRQDGRLAIGLIRGTTGSGPTLRLLESHGASVAGVTPTLDADVFRVVVLDDGRVVVGGDFTAVDGEPRDGIARFSTPGAGGAVLSVDDGSVRLQRGAAAAELLAAPRLSLSLDGNVFVFDQPLLRVGNDWRLDALALPLQVPYFIRVQESPGAGVAGASHGRTTRLLRVPPDLRLFRDGFEASP